MSTGEWVGVIIAGAVGAPARYVLDGYVQEWSSGTFPWGTYLVNMVGSFLLGLITGFALYHGLGDLPRTIVGTGFCGAFTTFSTFTFETVQLVEAGAMTEAFLNVGASAGVGLFAAAAGIALMAVM